MPLSLITVIGDGLVVSSLCTVKGLAHRADKGLCHPAVLRNGIVRPLRPLGISEQGLDALALIGIRERLTMQIRTGGAQDGITPGPAIDRTGQRGKPRRRAASRRWKPSTSSNPSSVWNTIRW